MIPVPGGVRVSAAAAAAALSSFLGCFLLAAAAVYYPATTQGAFLRADMVLAGISLAVLLPIAILLPPTYPGEPRIFGIRAWLVRRALGENHVVKTQDHGTVVAVRASIPSTIC